MKDLYAALSIGPDASESEVEASLEAHPELSAYSAILLDSEKRALYDRAHATLKMIGALRHRLGIDSGSSWFLKNSADYAPRQNVAVFSERSKVGSAQAASLQKTIHTPQTESLKSVRAARPGWLVPVIIAIIAVILVALILALI
jgi:t-SNARE complex subunit (syntaxin)